jgi:hypothetical protein
MSHLGHTDEPTMGSYLHISVETKYPYSRMQMARYLGGTAANGISAIGIGFIFLEGSFENSGCPFLFSGFCHSSLSPSLVSLSLWYVLVHVLLFPLPPSLRLLLVIRRFFYAKARLRGQPVKPKAFLLENNVAVPRGRESYVWAHGLV